MIITDWNGYKKINFKVGGRESYIVCPEKPIEGNPWVWRAEFFEAFNYADRELINKGWYLVYHCASDMYGNPESIEMMKEFYDTVTDLFGLGRKPAIFGFSRGGLYTCNFALKYPDCVGLMYLDAPVLDIRSWPGGKGTGLGEQSCWTECLECYGLTEETSEFFKGNPLDKAEEIAKLNIPIFMVCGAVDRYVPYCENGEPFFERVRNAGGNIERIVKPDCDHHPHSLSDPAPIIEFIEKNMP